MQSPPETPDSDALQKVAASEASDPTPTDRHRAAWLLLLGAASGLALATFGLLESRADRLALPPDAAARVGERTIRRVDYERVLAGVEADRRGPIDEAIRRRVMERMIDEELLVQRALDLGLASFDRRVRGELTSALLSSIVSEADAEPPSEQEVRAHFEENVDFFSRPGRIHARTIFFAARPDASASAGRAADRASRALARLRAGEDPDTIEQRLGDSQISPLPNGMLPPGKVRDYVGPKVLAALQDLAIGAWSEPIETGGGIYLARVIAREARVVPRYEDVKELVRQDLMRRRGDAALRRYLDDLRSRTSITIDEAILRDSGED